MVNNRLNYLLSYIENKENIICDVGSDHCYTSILALQTKKAKFVFNIDINKQPMQIGINNLIKNGLFLKTKNIIANGLRTLEIDKNIDYCIISGLGGHKIAEILNQKNEQIQIKKYVLLANNNPECIRQYVFDNKMRIELEDFYLEGEIYYFLIIISNEGLEIKNEDDVLFGPYNLKTKSINFLNYLKTELTNNDRLYNESKQEKFNTLNKKILKLLEEFRI
ncbi:MAG: tRNA (adenine(22)-N(1))-methyltransferase TrmK [Mycoplasmataceae bacterium]|jgi:tRNA (adenine22-N1)-methyltransferase|nr:tRNA (adenine(22)-N(1))-methyltransferase TrmK [Mycoplasmataceae bacterium]